MNQPQHSLEECAEASALLAHFRKRASAPDIAKRLGLDLADHERSRLYWLQAIRDQLEVDGEELARRFGSAVARKRKELETTSPSLEALSQSPGATTVAGHSALALALELGETGEQANPPAPAPRRVPLGGMLAKSSALGTPSYLLARAEQASVPPTLNEVRAVQIHEFDSEGTLDPTSNPLPVLPFASKASPERLAELLAATPSDPAADAGGTALLPIPKELADRLALAAAAVDLAAPVVPVLPPDATPLTSAFDPDATLDPVSNHQPVLPFSGTTSPGRLREIIGPPQEPADKAGETVLLGLPEEQAKVLGRVLAESYAKGLSLGAYAELRAALTVHGEDDRSTWERFRIASPWMKLHLQKIFFDRFAERPSEREEFEQLLRAALRKLNASHRG